MGKIALIKTCLLGKLLIQAINGERSGNAVIITAVIGAAISPTQMLRRVFSIPNFKCVQ
jgi:hypothetical protein